MYVCNTANGLKEGVLWMSENVGYRSGWVDVPYGISAYKRPSNGEYIVAVEEDERAKLVIYRYGTAYTSTTPVQTDDTSSQIIYSATWSALTGLSNRYENTLHRSSTSGSSAELTFNGTAIALFGDMNPSAGTISFKSNNVEVKTNVFQTSGLAIGSHTIKLVSKGNGWLYVDCFKYTPFL